MTDPTYASGDEIAPGFVLGYLGGNCPVQADGTVDGTEFFYFRARGQHWEFYVAPSQSDLFTDRQTFHYEEEYGDSPFAASWMTKQEAGSFIQKAAMIYRTRDAVRERPSLWQRFVGWLHS